MNGTSEPVITVGTISAAVAAIIALLVAFGVNLSDSQQTAILGVVAVVGPIVASIVTRGYVYPAKNVEKVVDASYTAGKNGDSKPTV